MKLIKQSYELLGTPQSLEEAWSFAAAASRNCYQSEKVRQDESEEDFCKRILLKGKDINTLTKEELETLHLSPLEFGIVYLIIDSNTCTYKEWDSVWKVSCSKFSRKNFRDGVRYVTTNLRVLVELKRMDVLKFAGPPTVHHMKACCFKFDTSIHVYKDLTRHEGALSFAIESTR